MMCRRNDMQVNVSQQTVVAQQISNIRRTLRLSLLVIILLTLASVFFFGKPQAQATIVGALVAWLSQLAFAALSFRYVGARQATNIYKSLWHAHTAKWLVTLLGFFLIFAIFKLSAPLFVVSSYIVLTVFYTVVLALLSRD